MVSGEVVSGAPSLDVGLGVSASAPYHCVWPSPVSHLRSKTHHLTTHHLALEELKPWS
jgi:hypothetical protein